MWQYGEDVEHDKDLFESLLAFDLEDIAIVEPLCMCTRCRDLVREFSEKKKNFAGYSRINPQLTEQLSPHQYFLCNRGIWAFLLGPHKWG
jgi:hypothetical protein